MGNQSGAVKRRLVDMGLTPGTTVKVTKVAPWATRWRSLRGYELSLRKDDAAQIRIGAPRRPAAREDGARRTDPERACKQLQDHVHELEQHGRPYDHSAHDSRPMRIALAGNPNCGKTTPVQRPHRLQPVCGQLARGDRGEREGTARPGRPGADGGGSAGDLPLSPYPWKRSWPDFIICEGPDAILNIVDATNLERNPLSHRSAAGAGAPLVLAPELYGRGGGPGTPSMWERLPAAGRPRGPHHRQDWPGTGRAAPGGPPADAPGLYPLSPTTSTTASPTTFTTAWASCSTTTPIPLHLPPTSRALGSCRQHISALLSTYSSDDTAGSEHLHAAVRTNDTAVRQSEELLIEVQPDLKSEIPTDTEVPTKLEIELQPFFHREIPTPTV